MVAGKLIDYTSSRSQLAIKRGSSSRSEASIINQLSCHHYAAGKGNIYTKLLSMNFSIAEWYVEVHILPIRGGIGTWLLGDSDVYNVEQCGIRSSSAQTTQSTSRDFRHGKIALRCGIRYAKSIVTVQLQEFMVVEA